MSTSTLGLFLRHLALSEEVSRLATAGDHDLLAAYESERGQATFTELMRRHGPMVLRTCRCVLGQGPDAEDAFQATFVLLARKAGSISKREALGAWLHRVAYRTALNVLTGTIRRRVRERQASVMTHPDPDPSAQATWNEIQPILDAELDALPEETRRLLIACYLQDKTHAEAAAELGLPRGSVAWRLEKARALLAERLAQRGIMVSSTLLAVLLSASANGAGVPAVLLVHTLEAARLFTDQAAGIVSEHVARLVKGGLTQMTKGSTHLSIALVGWVSLLGAGLLACQTLKAWPDQKPDSEPPAVTERTEREHEQTRMDRYGDPLPSGALVRLGTVRWRHTTDVHSLFFTHDGKGLIAAGTGGPARLWDRATGRLMRQFGDNRDGQVHAAALSPDGRTLAGRVGSTGDLCLWDVATGTLLRRGKASDAGSSRMRLAFSPDGKTVALGSGATTTLRLWEVVTGKERWVANGLPIGCLAYSADSKTLIWADHNGGLHLWDAATGKELRRWDDEKKRPISALTRAPDGRLFSAHAPTRGEPGGFVRLWDAATGKEVWQRPSEEGRITAAAFSPDGKLLATGDNAGSIRLWEAATGKELRRCADSQSTPYCLAFAPDGKTLASGNQTVRLWDVGTGREIRRAEEGHQGTVCSLAFTPNGTDIVSSSWEGSLRVWDAATGVQRRHVLPAGDKHFVGGTLARITSAVFPDGKTYASAIWDQTAPKYSIRVRQWDRDSSQELHSWSREFEKRPHALIFSPDGKTVACMVLSGSPEPVYLWEAATGKELGRIAGGYPAFSPDGRFVATAPIGKKKEGAETITLWETATAKKFCSIPGKRPPKPFQRA